MARLVIIGMAQKSGNFLIVNRVFNKVVCPCFVPKHGSGQSSVHYGFFQSTDVVNTNLFLSGF